MSEITGLGASDASARLERPEPTLDVYAVRAALDEVTAFLDELDRQIAPTDVRWLRLQRVIGALGSACEELEIYEFELRFAADESLDGEAPL